MGSYKRLILNEIRHEMFSDKMRQSIRGVKSSAHCPKKVQACPESSQTGANQGGCAYRSTPFWPCLIS